MVKHTTYFNAYAIPILHASKYPASDVCGVLLGKTTSNQVEIKTAIPFFHHWTTLSPMLEVALQQSDIYAKKNDLSIIGWYHANARLDDNTLPETAIKVAETIKKNNGDNALIFLVNNKQLSELDKNEPAIIPFINHENQWKKLKEPFTNESDISFAGTEFYSKFRGVFSSSGYNRIQDFDEHVEDVSIPWLETSKLRL